MLYSLTDAKKIIGTHCFIFVSYETDSERKSTLNLILYFIKKENVIILF